MFRNTKSGGLLKGGLKSAQFKKLPPLAIFLLLLQSFCVLSCASTARPDREYTIAFSALEDAKAFSADSPSSYSKARRLYQKGVSMYKKEDYAEAKDLFEKSIRFSEKTELRGRIKKARELEE